MTTTAIDVESKTLRIERDFQAPIERVFDAFTKPELAKEWWGPEGLAAPEIEFDLREGGAWRAVMQNDEGAQYTAAGVYEVIERPNRLVYTWGWVEDGVRGSETTVDIRLIQTEGGTRLTLVHGVFETVADRDDHGEGWTSTLKSLDSFLSKPE